MQNLLTSIPLLAAGGHEPATKVTEGIAAYAPWIVLFLPLLVAITVCLCPEDPPAQQCGRGALDRQRDGRPRDHALLLPARRLRPEDAGLRGHRRLDLLRRSQDHDRHAPRCARPRDDPRRHRASAARSSCTRSATCTATQVDGPLLRQVRALRLLDARHRALAQLLPDLHLLGVGRRQLVPADRLLLEEGLRR